MSILIEGMNIPKEGEYHMMLYVCDDGYAYVDVDLFPVDKDRFEAVPVPPHGRLIDADALREVVKKHATPSDAWVFSLIRTAPTIIEAEGEE